MRRRFVMAPLVLCCMLVGCGAPGTDDTTDIESNVPKRPKHPRTAEQVEDILDGVIALMSGSFSSAAQAAEDESYSDIRLEMVPIWTERSDARWLYVEQATAAALDKPYRQRVYRVSRRDDGAIVSAVYELPGDALNFAGAWRDPARFHSFGPDELSPREGCEVILTRVGKSEWTGSTVEDRCKSTLRGASYATSEVTLSAAGIDSWDRGYNDGGEQVWGAEAGPYKFLR